MQHKQEISGSLTTIKSIYNDLTPAEIKVADYIINNLKDVHRLSISQLATKCKVSEATLTRFSKSCGFSGFAEFRTSLIPDILQWQQQRYQRSALEELSISDSTQDVVHKFGNKIIEGCEHAFSSLDKTQLDLAVNSIIGAHKTILMGNGGSVYLAGSTALKLMKLGLNTISYLDFNGMLASTILLNENDVALAISHSGETRETLESMALAKGSGCTTIVVTGRPRSTLAKMGDINLFYGSVALPLGRESEIGISRGIQAIVMDLLATLISLRIQVDDQ